MVLLAPFSCDRAPEELPEGFPVLVFREVDRHLEASAASPAGRTVEFPFRNTGDGTLKIESLRLSCGCLKAVAQPTRIPPGGQGRIVVKLLTMDAGVRTARVEVLSNDGRRPHRSLRITWKTLAAYSPEPAELDFGIVSPGEVCRRQLRLRQVADLAGRCGIHQVTTQPASVVQVSEVDGKSARIHRDYLVTLTAPNEPGVGQGRLAVSLRDCFPSEISVPVRWDVRGPIDCSPRRIFLGSARKGQTLTGELFLTTTFGEPRVSTISQVAELPGLSVDWMPADGKLVGKVSWRALGQEGLRSGVLRVSVEPNGHVVEVPVSAYVLQASP